MHHCFSRISWAFAVHVAANGFPQCFGAVEGTRIFIKQPNKNATDFLNRINRFSVNVQATCNYKYCFSDVVVKWLGSVHDSHIFYNSALNKMLRDGAIPPLYKHLRVCPREDQAEVTHATSPISLKLAHMIKVIKLFKNPK